MTARRLFMLAIDAVAVQIRRFLLERRLRALYRLADYFRGQVENGTAGLLDTHKRIVVAESDLRLLK